MNLQALMYTQKPPFPVPFTSPFTDRTVTISTFKYSSSIRTFSLNPLNTFFKRLKNPNFKVVKCSLQEDKVLEAKDAALLVSTCITRTLPPALTLEQGLDSIEEAVEEFKSKRPCSTGMLTFQVAVPPSAKALNCFCSQRVKAGAFPLFFLSKEENSSYKSLALGRTRGVFGIGAAFYFKGYYSRASRGYTESQRFASTESTFPMVYGFLDVNYDMISSSIEHEAGSFCFFIPQIELHEFEEVTILVATIAWNKFSICSFGEAVQAYEFSLYQVRRHFQSLKEECSGKSMKSGSRNLNMDEKIMEMVCISALQLGGNVLQTGTLELKDASCCSSQFSALLSPTLAIANNMNQGEEHFDKMSYSPVDFQNINTVWASLIIEECTRLGLTYICVAPGSRSSPLAIAASAHPLTTCVACIDERSLAFHAVGYARGSHKPAVIITSSGTAASNLLPAVVEASQDFVPILLLTADRPPELQDVGANQAINQVNHFGPFVRQFFGLPAPTDEIFARTVLTTLDSAVNIANSSPFGPVHINCPFREPLVNIPKTWDHSCLKGLDLWMSTAQPFTTYIPIQHSIALNQSNYQMDEVIEVIQGADRGLLILGAIHTEDEIWAALLLAKHLLWPVAVDILSGLRLRKYMASFTNIEENILFMDHLDYLLLSDRVREWMQPDVVIQLGSRITSVRISQMLEHSLSCSYIMVDGHLRRHDPSHIVTYRIQCKINEFADCLIKACIPCLSSKWKQYLQTLEMMAAWETSFIISSEYSLTEPYVSHVIPEYLRHESAVFIGNSMPIRDADMYSRNQAHYIHNDSTMSRYRLPCHWVQVAGNRGASGIDGLLSTAVGFAVGCNKRVLCVVGDVSFLHDTNGLALLGQGTSRKPVIILVINNHGGGIFSLLPIANMTERRILDQFFYTSHNVSINHLCLAHSLKHIQVRTKMELLDALFTSQQEQVDCVIEVESCIDVNANFHRILKSFGRFAGDHTFRILSEPSFSTLHGLIINRIARMEYSVYRVKLCAPPTSTSISYDSEAFYREGFIISLSLEDGSTGYGEVAPLEIHKENILEVEEQLQFLIHALEGAKIDYILPLMKGSISSWIWNTLGISPGTIFPSVRCGLEMAVLNAIAAKENCTLLKILYPQVEEIPRTLLDVPICALIDSGGSPMDIANVATSLVEEGFSAIKIKVARGSNPIEDVAVIQEVRKKVGHQVKLRADANRNWTIDEALVFAKLVKDCDLQYIEEPVKNEDDILKFCEETGLPVALDETVNCIRENPFEFLEKYAHSGVVAVVIKPSIIGGFENAALLAQWAQQRGKMAVVSATFESGLGLSGYIQLSCYLDLQYADICRVMNKEPSVVVAHGLGTYKWLKEDVTLDPLNVHRSSRSGFVEACPFEAGQLMQQFDMNKNVIVRKFSQEKVRNYQLKVDLEGILFSINVLEMGESKDDNVIVFLHGFLGTGRDWVPIMKAISRSTRCVAIDLPGHGGSELQHHASNDSAHNFSLSMDVICKMLNKLFPQITPEKVILIGYSMGARIALYMSLKYCDKIQGAVLISGSPGLVDPSARMLRRARDDSRASFLVSYGLQLFLDVWYAEDLWNSLRNHPHFQTIFAYRLQHDDLPNLAKALSDLSIGRQPPLWEELKHCKLPLQLIVGENDAKFKKIAKEMLHKISQGTRTEHDTEIKEIPNSGHAVHIENPLPVIRAIGQFLKRIEAVESPTKDDTDALVPLLDD